MREWRRRAFPETFKREAVGRVRTSGLPIVRVAEELGLHETVLRRWITRYDAMASPRRTATPAATPSSADLAAENARLKRELQRAEMERDILKKAALIFGASSSASTPMKFGFVDEHRGAWPVRTMCRVLGVSPSGYYAWRSRPESRRSIENRELLDAIRRAHAESHGAYGGPRIHAVLRALGRRFGRHRVACLMRRAGLRGLAALPRRVRTTDSRHTYPIAPKRLLRNFSASAPNQVWLADLTYIATGEGWLYLAALIDMHTRKVVGWAMRETLHAVVHRARTDGATTDDRPRGAAHGD